MFAFETRCADETKGLAATLAPLTRPGDVIVLSGDLGAGKTQFSQGFARGLGIAEPVVSPTFNIVISYPDGRIPLYHFDLYRLESEDQLEDIDFFGIIEGDGVSLVEWGEKFIDAFDDEYLGINLAVLPDATRQLAVEAHGARAAALACAWQDACPSADHGAVR